MNGKRSPSDSVPPGYKRTEVGVIPEDWECRTLDEIAIVKGGKRLPKGFSLRESPSPYPYIRVSDMVEGSVSLADIRFVPEEAFPLIKEYRIFKDDIFISVAGTLGIVGIVPVELDGANLTENADRITDIKCDQRYLLYWLMSQHIQNEIESIKTIGAQPKLALGRIAKFCVALSKSRNEQRAIARALADADAWIEALERLIAKKRAVKQAAMGDLLTGRVRLPGFGAGVGMKHTEIGEIPEDWEVRSFGQLFSFLATSSCSRADLDEKGNTFYIHYGDIHTKWHFVLDFSKAIVPQISAAKVQNASPLQDGDLILVDASEDEEGVGKGVEIKNLGDKFAVAGLHTLALRPKTSELANGFKAYIQAMSPVKQQIRRLATGLKVFGLSRTNLADVLIPIPSKEEQQAIAQVLSDMDAEIEALERERDKARAIKQGMMQELLTGRIRLLKPQNTPMI